jgi:3-oxoacyl-[acyl-carrier-protein] synthase-3
MAFIEISNVKIKGVSACVPSIKVNNNELRFEKNELEKLIAAIGVEHRRLTDNITCTSDLCCRAAEELISELKWAKEEIDCLVFVSQTPDYILPATSCILQNRLGLSKECLTIDISLGCSGWIYGLSTIASLLSSSNGTLKKALLLVGDTSSKTTNQFDKTTWPLFGDAGAATALEHSDVDEKLEFHLATDGSGMGSIIIPDGGYRNITTSHSFETKTYEDGVNRNNLNLALDGMDVFSFAISKAPKSINQLIKRFDINRNDIDYYLLHQANLFLNKSICKKLNIEDGKVPSSLKEYGNTSSASIALTMVTEIRENLISKKLNHIACGFGVGLSWGSVYFKTDNIVCPKLIEY